MPMSNAERQAAFRERQKVEREQAELAAALEEERARRAEELEEQRLAYIADTERGARLAHRDVRDAEGKVALTVEQRVKNARKYAEWRWAGFHAGEIASL